MSSSNAPQKQIRCFVPEDFELDPCEIACGLSTIGSLAARCLESGEGTVNHDLIWSIMRIAEHFERQIASVRVSHE